jgi:hypothetical protein
MSGSLVGKHTVFSSFNTFATCQVTRCHMPHYSSLHPQPWAHLTKLQWYFIKKNRPNICCTGRNRLHSGLQLLLELQHCHQDSSQIQRWAFGLTLGRPNSLHQCFSNAGPSITPGRERPEETTLCYKISLVQLITNLNVILYLSTCHTVYISVLILFMIMP